MDERYEKIKKIADDIRSRISNVPEIAIILGSGLGSLADEIENKIEIEYNEIDEFPVPTVVGHAGKMVFGQLCGKEVVAFQGRIHYYECMDVWKATLITRIIKVMGVNKIILTNAAGGMGDNIEQGDIMAITDHISSFFPSPLIGKNIEELGERFPDMSNVYDSQIIDDVANSVKLQGIDLKRGVYLQTTGPNYETPAEIKMYKSLGADAVGMSTACEAMVASHMKMKVCGFSCITNMAAGISKNPLSHEEVAIVAKKASDNFKIVIRETIKKF